MFYGQIVKAGKPQPLVPHPDGYSLHLSQASLSASAKEGTRVSLLIKAGDEEPVVLCTLRAGAQDTVPLDQFLSEYVELSVEGKDSIHVTGYYSPQFGGDEGSDDEGEDYELDEYGGHPVNAVFGADESDDEDEEGESDDESETDDEDESDDIMAANHQQPSVIIEDITDKEPQVKALPASADDSKKRKAEPATDAAVTKKQAAEGQQQKQKVQQQQRQKEQKSADKQHQKQQEQQQQQKSKQKEQQKEHNQQQAAKTPDGKGAASTAAQPMYSKKGVKRYENGFEVHNTKMGDPHGKLAKAGKQVKVKYVGKLKSGKVFDKSGNKPFTFRLGVGEVIKGWDAGVEGMRVGDVRKLVIPPQMAYGSQRTGPIPPNSTLEFEVELVDVK